MKKSELLEMIRELNGDLMNIREARNKHNDRIKRLEGGDGTVKTAVSTQDIEPIRELASSVSRRVDELNNRLAVKTWVAPQDIEPLFGAFDRLSASIKDMQKQALGYAHAASVTALNKRLDDLVTQDAELFKNLDDNMAIHQARITRLFDLYYKELEKKPAKKSCRARKVR